MTTYHVHAGDNLQVSLNACTYGDTIILDAGATFDVPGEQIPFSLPNKGTPPTNTDADYITICSSELSSLSVGQRVTSGDAVHMSRIRARGGLGAFQVAINAQYWAFKGLEVTNVSDGSANQHVQDLIATSDSAYRFTSQPAHYIVDRCYIHPQEDSLPPTDPNYFYRTVSHGIALNVADLTVTNNLISGFAGVYAHAHSTSIDSEGMAYSTGPGPVTVHNNNFNNCWYASILWGGSDTDSPNRGRLTAAGSNSSFTITKTDGANPTAGSMLSVSNQNMAQWGNDHRSTEYSATQVSGYNSGTGVVTCSAPGLTWNGLTNEPTQAFTADPSTDVITSNNHLRSNGGAVQVFNSSGTLPSGLLPNTTYYVINATPNTFQLAATLGGPAIDITSTGTGTQIVQSNDTINPAPIPQVLPWQSATVDPTTNTFTSNAHGRANGGQVAFETSGTMPGGVAAHVAYWVINATANTFQIATSYNGTAVDITDSGSGTLTIEGTIVLWDGYQTSGVTITGNTFYVEPVMAQYMFNHFNSNGKGWMEIKNAINGLIEGNIFDGWPTTVGFGLQNQQGSAPWSACYNWIIRSNFFKMFSTPHQFSVTGYSRLTVRGHNFLITNNLAVNVGGGLNVAQPGYLFFFGGRGVDEVTYTHNTEMAISGSYAMGWFGLTKCAGVNTFKDNIYSANLYGQQSLIGNGSNADTFETYVCSNNLVYDNQNQGLSSIDTWWPNSIRVTTQAAIKWSGTTDSTNNSSTDIYRLALDSPGYQAASDGSDIGVNIDTLNAALLGNVNSGRVVISGNMVISGQVVVT